MTHSVDLVATDSSHRRDQASGRSVVVFLRAVYRVYWRLERLARAGAGGKPGGSDTALVISSYIEIMITQKLQPKKIGRRFSSVRKHEEPFVPDTSWSLDAVQNPLTQESKTSFAVHHAFNQFNSGDLSFHLTVIDGQG